MGLNVEIWQSDIEEGLYKNNEFLTRAVNGDGYVMQGKVVHIPQAGAPVGVERNRTSLPAAIVRRADTDVTYALDEFTSDPVLIANAEKVELSYDKRQSVLGEQLRKIKEVIADWMLYHWRPETAQLLPTSSPTNVTATAPGATGNRKAFTKEDLKIARLKLNKLNIPQEGRVALIPSELMDQLLDDDLKRRDRTMELDMKNGVVSRLYGFDLMERASVLTYPAGTTAKTPGATAAATDREAALIWQKDAVARALGEIVMFEREGDSTYYGDIYSFLVRMGGRKRRTGGEGVLGIVQKTA